MNVNDFILSLGKKERIIVYSVILFAPLLLIIFLFIMQYKLLKSIQKRKNAKRQAQTILGGRRNDICSNFLYDSKGNHANHRNIMEDVSEIRQAMKEIQMKSKSELKSQFEELSSLQSELKGDLDTLKTLLLSVKGLRSEHTTTITNDKKST